MIPLNKYNEHILNIIIESVKNDETILVLSDRFVKLIEEIHHPISKRILEICFDPMVTTKVKVTMLDINNKKDSNGNPILDSISFMTSNKAIEMAAKELEIELKKDVNLSSDDSKKIYRKLNTYDFSKLKGTSETSLGRIVNKLFPNEFDPNKDIEPFVNQFKSLRDTSMFQLVKGNDIIFWYNEINYAGNGQGPLNSSCMRYESCENYIQFYAKNEDKVSLLILKDKKDNTKIRGRALVWNLDIPENRIFMDRIYYTTEHLIDLFKEYATDNGWLYKKNQNMESNEQIVDERDDVLDYTKLIVKGLNDTHWGYYPYMDTLKYFNGKDLSNDGNVIDKTGFMEMLVDTHGGTSNDPGDDDDDDDNYYYSNYYCEELYLEDCYYCDWIEDYRKDNDCIYSPYYRIYIANDDIDEDDDIIECNYCMNNSDRWRLSNDTYELCEQIYSGETATKDFGNSRSVRYSNFYNGNVLDPVWSKHYNSYLDNFKCEDTIKVNFTNPDEFDWRLKGDNTYYEYNDTYYDNSVNKKDIIR